MWCSAWRALEGEDSEGQDKGLVRCRKMWQGTLCSHWSTRVSEQGSAGTGLYLCTAFFLFQASPSHKPVFRDGCDKRRETDRLSFTWSPGSACSPLGASSTHSSQLCAGLKHWILLCTFLVLLIFPAYSSGTWRQRCGLVCSVLHLVTKNPLHSGPQHTKCMLAHHVTTTLRSRLEKWSERKPDCAGREREVNMVTVSSYTLPLSCSVCANMRDNMQLLTLSPGRAQSLPEQEQC